MGNHMAGLHFSPLSLCHVQRHGKKSAQKATFSLRQADVWWLAINHVPQSSEHAAGESLVWHWHPNQSAQPSPLQFLTLDGHARSKEAGFCRRFLRLAVRTWVKAAARRLPGRNTHTALHPILPATLTINRRLQELHARHLTPTVAHLARSAVLARESPRSPSCPICAIAQAGNTQQQCVCWLWSSLSYILALSQSRCML